MYVQVLYDNSQKYNVREHREHKTESSPIEYVQNSLRILCTLRFIMGTTD